MASDQNIHGQDKVLNLSLIQDIIAKQSTSSNSYKSGLRWIHLKLFGNVETHLLLHPVTHNNHFRDDRCGHFNLLTPSVVTRDVFEQQLEQLAGVVVRAGAAVSVHLILRLRAGVAHTRVAPLLVTLQQVRCRCLSQIIKFTSYVLVVIYGTCS